MTDFPEDEAMLETSIALSGSMMAFERLPLAEAPVLDRSNSDLSFDVRRNGLKAGKPAGATTREIPFGSFRLLPAQFLLLEGDKPVPLGSRAMHILIVLLERPASWSPSRN